MWTGWSRRAVNVLLWSLLAILPATLACGQWAVHTIEPNHPFIGNGSLKLDAMDRPLIAIGGDRLSFARWDGATWGLEVILAECGLVFPSLQLDLAGNPRIAYYVDSQDRIETATWNGSSWDIAEVADAAVPTSNRWLAIDSTGNPNFCYCSPAASGFRLEFARWNGTTWDFQVVDPDASADASLRLDAADRPNIAYRGLSNQDVRLARWNGTAWDIQIVDNTVQTAFSPALDIDSSGPAISYHDFTNKNLKLARWTGASWDIQTVESAGDVGAQSSIRLDGSGFAHIAYSADLTVKYARWNGTAWVVQNVDLPWCSSTTLALEFDGLGRPAITYTASPLSLAEEMRFARLEGSVWNIQDIDRSYSTGLHPSLTLDGNGYPVFSYSDVTADNVKVARWTGSSWDIVSLGDGSRRTDTSLKLDQSGFAAVSYCRNADIKYAHWTGSAWDVQVVDSAGAMDASMSLALDAADHPAIAYHHKTNRDLKYARWNGSAWDIQTVDSAGDVGAQPSLVLDRNDDPVIAYVDTGNGVLRCARWNGSAWDVQAVDGASLSYCHTSLTLDPAGNPVISYAGAGNDALKLAHWTGSAWDLQTVGAAEIAGYTSVALDPAGNPVIAYGKTEVRYARWDGSTWWIEIVPGGGYVLDQTQPSLALSAEGAPFIAFADYCAGVKVARHGLQVKSINIASDSCPFGGPGDADGLGDPGERIGLRVRLVNADSRTLTGIRGTLSSSAPGVTVTGGPATIPALAAGDEADLTPDFSYSLAPTVACGAETRFTLHIVDDQGNDEIPLAVRVLDPCNVCVPQVGVESFTVQSDSCSFGIGDQNGIIEPGETISFNMDLFNGGNVEATTVSAVISSTASGVSIVQDRSGFPDIPAGQSRTSTALFVFTTDPFVVACGAALPFSVDIASNGGSASGAFSIDIPLAGCRACSPPAGCALGVPGRVTDLTLTRSGADLLCSWTEDPGAQGGWDFYETDDATAVTSLRRPGHLPAFHSDIQPYLIMGGATAGAAYYQVLGVCADGTTQGPN